MVEWDTMWTSKWDGGLGLPNLRCRNFALRARWLWLKMEDNARHWADLDITIPHKSREIYRIVVFVEWGITLLLYWEDQLLLGWRVEEIASHLYNCIRPCISATRIVQEALSGA